LSPNSYEIFAGWDVSLAKKTFNFGADLDQGYLGIFKPNFYHCGVRAILRILRHWLPW